MDEKELAIMERVSDNKCQMVTVGDSAARELNYFYKTVIDSLSESENINSKLVCCDNKVNQNYSRGGVYFCKYCRQEVRGDDVDHRISLALLYELLISTVSLVGSQLSTTCTRPQKNGESLASLTFGSHLDVTHSIINLDSIGQQKKTLEGPVSKEGRSSKAKELERKKVENGGDEDKEDEYIVDSHPCVGGEMPIEETEDEEKKREGRYPLLVPFDTNNDTDVLSHLSLSGGGSIRVLPLFVGTLLLVVLVLLVFRILESV